MSATQVSGKLAIYGWALVKVSCAWHDRFAFVISSCFGMGGFILSIRAQFVINFMMVLDDYPHGPGMALPFDSNYNTIFIKQPCKLNNLRRFL